MDLTQVSNILTQGLNPSLLHWQVGSLLPLVPPGKPTVELKCCANYCYTGK